MKAALRKHDDKARTLMQNVLRDGGDLSSEYPTIFGEHATGSTVCIEEGGELHAACAVLPRDLLTPHARLRAGLIGSVVTHSDHRNRGLGTRLVAAAEDALRDAGCAVALLWADERGFYAHRGWREIGSERDFIVTGDVVGELPATEAVRARRTSDADAIHELYLRHEQRVDRTALETRALIECPGMQVLVSDIDGRVNAYACLGRGRDLSNVIHEWGGDVGDVLGLIRAHFEACCTEGENDSLFVMAPGAYGELHAKLALAGVASSVGVLAMGRVLDADALASQIADLLGPRGVVRARASSLHEGEFEFSGPRGQVILAEDQLLDVLIPARGERGAARDLAHKLGVEGDRLPLSPFVWGLDSI